MTHDGTLKIRFIAFLNLSNQSEKNENVWVWWGDGSPLYKSIMGDWPWRELSWEWYGSAYRSLLMSSSEVVAGGGGGSRMEQGNGSVGAWENTSLNGRGSRHCSIRASGAMPPPLTAGASKGSFPGNIGKGCCCWSRTASLFSSSIGRLQPSSKSELSSVI